MFCQEGHKIGRRILRAHAHSQSLVFQRESDRGTSDFLKTVLSNRRPASIASRVSQEMLFGLEVSDMGAPPSVFACPAEQIGREAELRPGDKPKVNVSGIEELVTDKGYHSGAVVKRVKSYEVRSYIPEKQQRPAALSQSRRHYVHRPPSFS